MQNSTFDALSVVKHTNISSMINDRWRYCSFGIQNCGSDIKVVFYNISEISSIETNKINYFGEDVYLKNAVL